MFRNRKPLPVTSPLEAEAPAAPSVADSIGDPLREVRVLKRRVQLFVYIAIFASEPFYYFVVGYTLWQLIPGLAIGLFIAVTAIEGAFYQMFRLRKRSSYPQVLHKELGEVASGAAAAERALAVTAHLLKVDAGCIVLQNGEGTQSSFVLGASGEECHRYTSAMQEAMDEAMRTGESTWTSLQDESGGQGPRIVAVPLVALGRPTGCMALRFKRGADLKDSQLLRDIGVALGLSLENWRQREELRQGEERLKTVVSNMPVVLFAISREGVFTLSEGRGLDDLGLKPGQVVGMRVRDVYAEAPQILSNIERALGGESFSELVELQGLWWETSYSPVLDGAGNVSGLIGVAANVTERRQAEMERREADAKYRELVEDMNDVIYAQDENGIISFVSPAIERVAGYTVEEIIGKRASDFVHPDDYEPLAGDPLSEPREFRVITKAGEERWLRSSLQAIMDGDEQKGLRGVLVDITERAQAEEALRQSEEKYRDLVENSNEIIFTLDTSAVVTYISPAVEPIGGYKPEEVMGRSSTEFIHPDDQADVAASFMKIVNGEFNPSEYRLRLKTGEYRWVRSASKPIYEGTQIVGIRGVLVDITERKLAEEALQRSERRFRALVENSTDGIALGTADGTITYAGPSTRKILGFDPEELIGRKAYDFMHEDDVLKLMQTLGSLAGVRGASVAESFRVLSRDGGWRWIECVLTNLLEEPGVQAIVSNYRDITERKLAEQALERSEETHKALATAIPDMMLRVRRDGTIIDYKGDEMHVLPLPPSGPVETSLQEVLTEHAPQFMRFVDIALSTRESQVFEYQQAVGGRTCEFEARIVASTEDEAVAIVRDITERKNSEKIIRQLAYHDALTGLPNRALFEDRLKMALAQSKRSQDMLAVMFLDLDRFKLVNDTLGHGAGDKLLCLVADELTNLLREGDTVARVGGDEFTLLLPGIGSTGDAIEVANRILQRLKAPKRIAEREFRVTTSIGVTVFPADGEDPETLLRNADTAMYRAKDRGRDNFQLYTPQMNETVVEKLSLESDLRRALENEEFVVYYQPIANIASGHFVGAEALVRWKHGERGLVQPDDFIPFAEETGLIIPLGEWVLRESVRQAKAWIDAGLPPLRLTVNLSARQLSDEPLVEMIASALKDSGLPAERLQLEITEGAMMHNVESAIRTVKEIRHLGVGVAVDDFGTGYSSLSYLKRFPVDTVKIDRSFVRDLTIDPNDAAIVTTVLAMARNLGLHVVAEGVETRQQLEFLRKHNCHEFQGYLLSRPITGDEFVKLIKMADVARPRKNGAKTTTRSG
jgi:diguanylate cyclase (GGDEF)-like protein/PAS domain S-box-containing protein